MNLKVKSVQFDQYGAILTLTGKTGTRRRRVYAAVPDLRELLNNHPERNNPEASLFLTIYGKPFGRLTLWRRVVKLGERILRKHIHPHMFRHTGATAGSKLFTDREMMLLGGWHDAESVSVYSHLSMRDIDEKDLVLHGLKRKEEILRPVMQTRRCPNCQEENAPVAVYCVKCGGLLANEQLEKLVNEDTVRKMVDEYLAKRTEVKQ